MRSDGLTTDGVHLNERGNRFVADLMLEHLELYHLAEDPLENVNLAQHPEQVERIRTLRARLDAWWSPGLESDREEE